MRTHPVTSILNRPAKLRRHGVLASSPKVRYIAWRGSVAARLGAERKSPCCGPRAVGVGRSAASHGR